MSKAIVRRLTVEGTAFFLCDQQARFNEVIHNAGLTVAVGKSLVSAAKAFDIPLIVTEQYPKALGHTLDVLLDAAPESRSVFAKTQFSMVCESSQAAIDGLLAQQVRNVVLWGWESHVCVQQTCLDMLERGVNVWIVADGVSSQRPYDREVAIANMRGMSPFVASAHNRCHVCPQMPVRASARRSRFSLS